MVGKKRKSKTNPSRWARTKSVVYGLLLLAVAGGSGWYLRNESHFFIVESTPFVIDVPEGHMNVAAKLKPELLKILSGVQEQNIWRSDLRGLKRQILGQEWVKDVHLQRRFPNEISVHVSLEDVLFNYMNSQSWQSITRSGKRLIAKSAGALPDRPVLKTKAVFENQDLLQKVIRLFNELPNTGAFQRKNIGEVRWQKTEGLTLLLLEEGATVHLGHENISTKGLQVLRVTDYLKSQKQKARVIDASFNKKVLVRLRKRS